MSNRSEHTLAGLLAAWPAAEDRVTYLYELDPTHVASQSSTYGRSTERQGARESRSPLPFCLLSDVTVPASLLELDPAHL